MKQETHGENIQKAWKVDMVNMILVSQQNPEIWGKCLALISFQGTMESLWATIPQFFVGHPLAFTFFSLQMCFD